MTSESEENSNSVDKNLTEYEKIWKRIREQINVTAKEYVRPLYNALISDGYTPKEARDKVKKDAFNVWSAKTIDDEIPVEAKEPIKVLVGQLGQEKKKLLRQTEVKQSPISEKKEEYTSVQIESKHTIPREPETTIPPSPPQQPFWVDFFIKIGAGGIKFNLLIDPNQKKVMEYKRSR